MHRNIVFINRIALIVPKRANKRKSVFWFCNKWTVDQWSRLNKFCSDLQTVSCVVECQLSRCKHHTPSRQDCITQYHSSCSRNTGTCHSIVHIVKAMLVNWTKTMYFSQSRWTTISGQDTSRFTSSKILTMNLCGVFRRQDRHNFRAWCKSTFYGATGQEIVFSKRIKTQRLQHCCRGDFVFVLGKNDKFLLKNS